MAGPAEDWKKNIATKGFQSRDQGGLDFGKLPPQARELEQAVIGALMIEKRAIYEIGHYITPDCFYIDAHSRIYSAILALYREEMPIDMLTVMEKLKSTGELDVIGGPFALSQLTNTIGSAANIGYHARIIYEKYLSRLVISHCTELIKQSYEDTYDVFDTLKNLEASFTEIAEKSQAGKIVDLAQIVGDAAKEIRDSIEAGKRVKGIESSHSRINVNLGGYQPGRIIIMAARPGMGKTSWMISQIMDLIAKKVRIMAFNGEMLEQQFFFRAFCNYSNVPNYIASHNRFSQQQRSDWLDAEIWLSNQNQYLTLDFTAGIHIDELVAKVKKIKRDKGLDLVFIDFIQDVENVIKGENRDMQLGNTMKKLKNLAKNEKICLVILSHLTREVDRRGDKRPTMADLRESGNLENYADAIMFMVRPDYYLKKDSAGKPIYENPEQLALKDITQVYCDKNRDGPVFSCDWECSMSTNRFRDVMKYEADEYAKQLEMDVEPPADTKNEGFTRKKEPDPEDDLPF